jgi:hypothetical protein
LLVAINAEFPELLLANTQTLTMTATPDALDGEPNRAPFGYSTD